ncbi:hypothetical protein ACLGIH_17120 [Streptomyces sp. HMX87]|uniref:hypothetical protein n=1 Tax=Streptomyces sp. HMX87 TaxID=3390849 RepID=UPI003A85C796
MLRLLALVGVVACAVVLPYAVATAGSGETGGSGRPGWSGRPGEAAGDDTPARDRVDGKAAAPGSDDGRPGGPGDGRPRGPVGGPAFAAGSAPGLRTPTALDPGPATAVRCGPELASPGGIEAQTCVLNQGEETWARIYYRNATGDALDAVLSLMGPGDRTLRTRCAVGAEDEPGTCETPRQRTRGEPSAYTAVAEFADRAGYGPLLLRSGSNPPGEAGS